MILRRQQILSPAAGESVSVIAASRPMRKARPMRVSPARSSVLPVTPLRQKAMRNAGKETSGAERGAPGTGRDRETRQTKRFACRKNAAVFSGDAPSLRRDAWRRRTGRSRLRPCRAFVPERRLVFASRLAYAGRMNRWRLSRIFFVMMAERHWRSHL